MERALILVSVEELYNVEDVTAARLAHYGGYK